MTNDLTIIERVQQQHLSLVERAGAVDVYDETSADAAGRLLMEVKRAISEIEDARTQITKPLLQAKTRADDQAKAAKKPYEEAKSHLDGVILAWTLAERRRIEEENARAEEERVALEAAAMRAADEGRFEEAEQLQQQRDSAGTVEKVHRAAGTQARFTWQGEVTSLTDLILAVASGEAPETLLTVDQTALNAFARATKGKTAVKGVRFTEKPTLASTGRA